MGLPAEKIEVKPYIALPTIRRFHHSNSQKKCIVGPVGSGKTAGASMEVCWYIPMFLYRTYGIKKTRGAIIRNTYSELIDTTQATVFDWFPDGDFKVQRNDYLLEYKNGVQCQLLFRACDFLKHIRKFKSLELTWYWIDESIEVKEEIKRMLKNRIGRYPAWEVWDKAFRKKFPSLRDLSSDELHDYVERHPTKFHFKFGVETTNPPDVEHPLYSQYNWDTPPPGPVPEGIPLENHKGFWQPPYENRRNLTPNYYEDLRNDYKDAPDWADMYVDGKPGIIVEGKLVYNNFNRDYHVATETIPWTKGTLYRGWDNSGNTPACVVCQVPSANRVHVLTEYWTDRQNIEDFTNHVVADCNIQFPNAEYEDWGDPAGEITFSQKGGGFTSNKQLMFEAAGVEVMPSEQNLIARINAVDRALGRIDCLLIDPSCRRLINGFLGGYCYQEIGTTGRYADKPLKNRFSHCFTADTPISTPKGNIPICKLKVGNFVDTPIGPRQITATMNSRQDSLLKLIFSDNSEVVCTKDHPFIDKNGCIIPADALQYGHVLKSIKSEKGKLKDTALPPVNPNLTDKQEIFQNSRVYDLTVDKAHCFFANGILVSNCHDALQYVLLKLLSSIQADKKSPGFKPRRSWRQKSRR